MMYHTSLVSAVHHLSKKLPKKN